MNANCFANNGFYVHQSHHVFLLTPPFPTHSCDLFSIRDLPANIANFLVSDQSQIALLGFSLLLHHLLDETCFFVNHRFLITLADWKPFRTICFEKKIVFWISLFWLSLVSQRLRMSGLFQVDPASSQFSWELQIWHRFWLLHYANIRMVHSDKFLFFLTCDTDMIISEQIYKGCNIYLKSSQTWKFPLTSYRNFSFPVLYVGS